MNTKPVRVYICASLSISRVRALDAFATQEIDNVSSHSECVSNVCSSVMVWCLRAWLYLGFWLRLGGCQMQRSSSQLVKV